MKLLILILKKVEVIDKLLKEFTKKGIKGGTILKSKGMAEELIHSDELGIILPLKNLIDMDREKNMTLLFAIHDEQVPIALSSIEEVVGDLEKPNTGVLFILPIDYVKGLQF